jgi:hopanoid C-3 methylase
VRVLLIRPVSPNERFGVGPFFRVEPLGLEYVAAALGAEGHEVRIADLRFGPRLSRLLYAFRPRVVGIACSHTVDVPAVLGVAKEVRRVAPGVFTLAGGHAASAYPEPLLVQDLDAVAVGDSELTVPELVGALARGSRPTTLPGIWLRGDGDAFTPPAAVERASLDRVPLPARELLADVQSRYFCVQKMPLWALETNRGCPYRCTFCSIWRHHGRTLRSRGIGHVSADFARVGHNVFVVDDLFFQPSARSLDLARELTRRGVRKDWMVVQARLDTVAKHSNLLSEWRPLARQFDLFFGFEAPSDHRLESFDKRSSVHALEEGVRVARSHGFGVTGNFLVDPDWEEADFRALWDLVDRLGLERSGYTVLTPLPGTPFFDRMRARIQERDWARYDMHHILWEPRLGRRRFFELFTETWRRNVLNPTRSRTKWLKWLSGLSFAQALTLARIVYRTRRLLDVDAYLDETFPLAVPAVMGDGPCLDRGAPVGVDRSVPTACPLVGAPPGSEADRAASKTL